ncbi:MAG: hypothetical protein WC022_02010 [Parcubacteria group bacterium]
MLGISTIDIFGLGNFGKGNSGHRKRTAVSNCSVLNMRECSSRGVKKNANQRNSQINLKMEIKSAWLALAAVVVFSGALYLFQVNSLAAKGYELKELQNSLLSLQEANKKGRIQEVELMSMYNIEKVTQNSDLVSLNNATYLELNGPVAMK